MDVHNELYLIDSEWNGMECFSNSEVSLRLFSFVIIFGTPRFFRSFFLSVIASWSPVSVIVSVKASRPQLLTQVADF